MRKLENYSTPVVDIVEVATENGIANSAGFSPAPGQTGTVNYDSTTDNYDF